MRGPADRRVVACNYGEATSVAPQGALAFVVYPDPDGFGKRVELLVRSRSGRWVRKYEDIRRVTNFRAKTVPPEHPRHGDKRLWDHEAEGTAAKLAEARARRLT